MAELRERVSTLNPAPIRKCVRCGFCCSQALCMFAVAKCGPKTRCPFLRHVGKQYLCGLIEDAKGEEKRRLMEDLSIGAGCSSGLNTRRKILLVAMEIEDGEVLGDTPGR